MFAALKSRGGAFLAQATSLRWLVLLGVLLAAPSLNTGLVADDYIHAVVLRGLPTVAPTKGPLDLFRFADGDAKRGQALIDSGEFPWLARPTLHFSFFRPLSSLTHLADYKLWPDSPWAMHAQNLVWFAICLALAALVYRRFLGTGLVAGLAMLAFAIDDAHGPVVGWIANRNALVAFALAVPVLLLHDRARREHDVLAAVLAPLFLATSLFAGESSLAIGGYLFAHAVHLDRSTWKSRLTALSPYALVVIAWRALYSHLGYGVAGSGIYLDPLRDPRAFLAALPVRFVFLLIGQLGKLWSDLATIYADLSPWLLPLALLICVSTLAFLAWAALPLLKSNATARFFASGMLLATLPICATFPADRLLLFVGLGGMGLVAMLCTQALTPQARVARGFLILCHFIIAPISLPIRSRSMMTIRALIALADDTIPRTPDIVDKTVILLDPPNDIFGAFVPAMRNVLGVPRPNRFRILAGGTSETDVQRVDARSIRITPAHGFFEPEIARLLRGAQDPFLPGEKISISGLEIVIESVTKDSRPASALFTFDERLENSKLVWLAWTEVGYAPWQPPPIGQSVSLPERSFWRAIRYSLERREGGTK
jgi:hypothetical protein